jgi:acyl carrier protein
MDSPSTAHQELLRIAADSRARFVEARLVGWIAAARAPDAPPFDGLVQLSDLGVDSLQLVDIKFELDQLVGTELDIGLFIKNPTLRELAQGSLRASGL